MKDRAWIYLINSAKYDCVSQFKRKKTSIIGILTLKLKKTQPILNSRKSGTHRSSRASLSAKSKQGNSEGTRS